MATKETGNSTTVELRWSVTYDDVTPESAEDGDVEDRGFMLPGGWDVSTMDAPTGPAFLTWCEEYAPDRTGTLRDFLHDAKHFGCTENGGPSWYALQGVIEDYSTGTERSYAIHLEPLVGSKLTDVQVRRIDRLIRGQCPWTGKRREPKGEQ